MAFWTTVFAAGLGAFFSSYLKEWLGHLISRAKSLESIRDLDLERLEEVVFEVRDLAVGYWSKPDIDGDQKPTGAAISGRILFAGQLAERLFQDDDSLKAAVNLELNRFDDVISNSEFGVSNRNAEPNRIAGIEISAYNLAHKAVVCRRKLKKKFLIFK